MFKYESLLGLNSSRKKYVKTFSAQDLFFALFFITSNLHNNIFITASNDVLSLDKISLSISSLMVPKSLITSLSFNLPIAAPNPDKT